MIGAPRAEETALEAARIVAAGGARDDVRLTVAEEKGRPRAAPVQNAGFED